MARKGAATMERDEMTDTNTEAEAEVLNPEGTEAEATEAEKSTRPKTLYAGTDFDMEALDELPDNPKVTRTGGGRAKVYFDLLEKVAEAGVDGKWRLLARFGTSTGAKTVALALNRQVAGKIGEGKGLVHPDAVRDIPEYEGHKWVFDSRRVPDPENAEKVNSILYAKLVPASEVPVDTEATEG